ncbi:MULTISPECIES: hypothetical protein [unclassified Flavobacterium]|uniref:hypothetical protein n=1 Tax=unclassified Flavobacterium TaxID=196869 RepID=UPI001290AA5B|nr:MULTISPECIES: hypothetical protein [unclassified Flavobacterium]MQP53188.1 hypothetical protein [Flavobacterium sp. LMO9]MQP62981.1 hypothetical protein [Flavobacterium sp. LMO6]
MKKQLLYFLIFILIVSCKLEKNSEDSSENDVKKQIETIVVQEQEQYIENEPILAKMESDLFELTKNPKFALEKELVNNRHVDDLIDTLKTYKFDKVSIQSYKTSNEEWICGAKILNSEFKLLKSIKIGINKSTFEKAVKTKVNSNIVKIGNLEQTSVFVFKFKNNFLAEIVYEGYVD